jgi:hypothetical protein
MELRRLDSNTHRSAIDDRVRFVVRAEIETLDAEIADIAPPRTWSRWPRNATAE